MAAIAAFATTEQGALYGSICDRWGVDPAAGFEDDVVAFNLRLALSMAPAAERRDAEPEDEWAAAARDNERTWLGG